MHSAKLHEFPAFHDRHRRRRANYRFKDYLNSLSEPMRYQKEANKKAGSNIERIPTTRFAAADITNLLPSKSKCFSTAPLFEGSSFHVVFYSRL